MKRFKKISEVMLASPIYTFSVVFLTLLDYSVACCAFDPDRSQCNGCQQHVTATELVSFIWD